MLKIEHLTKNYGKFTALRDLNLEIPAGPALVVAALAVYVLTTCSPSDRPVRISTYSSL